MSTTNRDVLERLKAAFAAGRFGVVYDLAADDYVEEYPQSGEVIRGRETARAIDAAYPGGLPAVIGGTGFTTCGDEVIVEAVWDYGEGGRYHVLAICRVSGGQLAASRMYFAAPFPPADWRRQWVEVRDPAA
jgi:hypothetical protein